MRHPRRWIKITDTNSNVQEDKTPVAAEAKVEPTADKTVAQATEAKTEEKKAV